MKKKFFLSFTISLVVFFVGFMIIYDSIFVADSFKSNEPNSLPIIYTPNDKTDEKEEVTFLLCG